MAEAGERDARRASGGLHGGLRGVCGRTAGGLGGPRGGRGKDCAEAVRRTAWRGREGLCGGLRGEPRGGLCGCLRGSAMRCKHKVTGRTRRYRETWRCFRLRARLRARVKNPATAMRTHRPAATMSSKVWQPDETSGVEPLVWRQMHASGPARTGVDAEVQPDSRERLAALQQQYEKRAREAHDAGLKEGEAVGRQRAGAELQPVIDRLSRAIEEIGGLRNRLRAEAEADLIQLSLAIAKRVLRRELAIDPDALHGLVLGALDKLQGQEISRVRVHPFARRVGGCEPAPELRIGERGAHSRPITRSGGSDF